MQIDWIVLDLADKVTDEMLIAAVRAAYSIESYDGHSLDYIGTVHTKDRPEWLYRIYSGSGGYWYRVQCMTLNGNISIYESIFGYPESKAKFRRNEKQLEETRDNESNITGENVKFVWQDGPDGDLVIRRISDELIDELIDQ